MRQKAIHCIDGINSLLAYIASFMLFAATLIVVVDAVLRYTGFGGFTWAAEASNILVIVMVYLMLPYMEFHNKQLSVGILTNLVKNSMVLRMITLIRGLVTLALSGALIVNFIKLCEKAIRYNYKTTVIEIPRVYLFAIIAFSLILVVVAWLGVLFLKKCLFQNTAQDAGQSSEMSEKQGGGDA